MPVLRQVLWFSPCHPEKGWLCAGDLAPSSPLREQQKGCSNPLFLGLCQPGACLWFNFCAATGAPSNQSSYHTFSLRRWAANVCANSVVCSCPFLVFKNIYLSQNRNRSVEGKACPGLHMCSTRTASKGGDITQSSPAPGSALSKCYNGKPHTSHWSNAVFTTTESISQEHKTAREDQHFPCSLHHKKLFGTNDSHPRTGGASWKGFLRWFPLPWTWVIHSVCLHASSTAELARLWISRL